MAVTPIKQQTQILLLVQPIGNCSASNYISPSTWCSLATSFRKFQPQEIVHAAAQVLVTHRWPVFFKIFRAPNEVNDALTSRQENAVTLIGDMGVEKSRFEKIMSSSNVSTALLLRTQFHHVVRVLGKVLQDVYSRLGGLLMLIDSRR